MTAENECTFCGRPSEPGCEWCTECDAAGACQRCANPMVSNGSVDADREEGLCGACVEGLADAARAKADRALDMAEALSEDAAEAMAEDAR